MGAAFEVTFTRVAPRLPAHVHHSHLYMLTDSTVGHSVIPRDIACCEATIALPAFPVRNSSTSDYSANVFVVDDLTKHPDLNNRPYVTSYPNSRSYIGVPITTPDGTNIGSYCILDDQPRQGVSQTDIVFMRDMAQTVMSHLETVRALSERSQRNQMLSGLGSFVRNTSSFEGRRRQNTGTIPMIDGHRETTIETHLPDALTDSQSTHMHPRSAPLKDHDHDDVVVSQKDRPPSAAKSAKHSEEHSAPPPDDIWKNVHLDRQNRSKIANSPKSSSVVDDGSATRPPAGKSEPGLAIRNAYQRAAETLCRSLEIDGVAILDASVGVFGGLGESSESAEASSTRESDDSVSSSTSFYAKAKEPHAPILKACPVLGCAQTMRYNETNSKSSDIKITESMLRDLLRRYPKGKVWLYDEDGTTYSEDEESADDSRSSGFVKSKAPHRMGSQSLRKPQNDSTDLQRAFPGARCIAIHGIYDRARKRWAVGSLFWTYDPFRVLTSETEMPFVDTFSDILVAELRRLESMGSDKAKSDFISSISHELRSPLHGILGSAEILSDLDMDNTASTLVEQIDSCGHTLLEIIDHLLEFAELKKMKRHARKNLIRSRSGRTLPPMLRPAGHAGSADQVVTNAEVTLDTATEEAVVSAAYSFYYNQSDKNRTNIPVILDIDHLAATTWHSALPVGGWKRVCLNLVTNALKYTPTGYVRVEMKQKPRLGFRRRSDVVLTISDSGIGMSTEFQQGSLFRDFAQEDTMSSGLGLGMHMVSQILAKMGGRIEVNSTTDGSGTHIVVTAPLDSDRSTKGLAASTDKLSEAALMSTACKGLAVGVVAEPPSPPATREDVLRETASNMTIASIEKKCRFLGAVTERCSWIASASAGLRIVAAAHVEACFQLMRDELATNAEAAFAPTLVVCNNIPAAKTIRDRWFGDPLRHAAVVEYVALPCSMKQLVRAVESVLQSHKSLRQPFIAHGTPPPTDQKLTAGKDFLESPTTTSTYPLNIPPRRLDSLPAEQKLDSQTLAVSAIRLEAEAEPTGVAETTDTRATATGPYNADGATSSDQLPADPSISHSLNTPANFPISLPLPRSRASIQQASSVTPKSELSSKDAAILTPTPSSKDPILLIVDDNPVNLKLLKMFATKAGYPHVTGADGQLAVDAFRSRHEASLLPLEAGAVGVPNVILMDINMPVMDGYEATQRIRSYEKNHGLAPAMVIAVTALQSEAAQAEAFGSGFNMFLSKPVKLRELAKIITER